MSASNFLSGLETVAAKGETELSAILAQVTALQASLQAVGVASPVMASLAANLLVAEAFLKMAVTDTTPFVTALEQAVAALIAAKS
jgi:hypothetical protein